VKFRLVVAVVLIHSSPVFASLSLEQVLTNMQNQNHLLTNIQFEFHQHVQFLNATGSSDVSGVALFERPGKVKIQKEKPEAQVTISNGKKMWVYTPAYKQVWEGTVKRGIESQFLPKGIVPLENFVDELEKDFIISFSKSDASPENVVWLSAKPKDESTGYQLELCVSTLNWLPIKTIFQSDSAKIVTELLNTQINLAIPTNTFRFLPPKGVDVIPIP
jgi:outer membrane lipoprotein carrier protein